MLASRGLLVSAQALVHPSVAPRDRDRHASFVARMLSLVFVALGVAPIFLAIDGAPKPAESLLFALALVPAGAAMLVARTGRLALGHLVASVTLGLAGLVLCFPLHAGAGVAIAWLAAAAIEAAASLDRRVTRAGLLGATAAAGALVVAAFAGYVSDTLPQADVAMIAGLALVVAALSISRLAAALADRQAEAARGAARATAIETTFGRMVVGFDRGGSVTSLEAPAGSLLDAPKAEILGRGFFDHVHVADRPAFLKLIDEAALAESPRTGTLRLRGWSEALRDAPPCFHMVEMRVGPLAHGAPEAVIAVLDDVSAQAGRDDEVETARRAATEASLGRDQFLATMSHELRTPLNSIIGFSDILASRTTRPDDVAKQCEYARTIAQSGKHLLSIVNAVLDMSRIKVGTYALSPEPFDAVALLDQSLDALGAAARDAGVRLVRERPDRLEEIVGDRRALRQALVALLDNAVKFTPARGTVTLGARPVGTSLVVSIADTGVGIAPTDLARIGEPFFQVAAGSNRDAEGSGLGLALVRGLVGLHGGALRIESEVGRGTTVTVTLPLDCRAIARRTADPVFEIVPPRRVARHAFPRTKDAA